MHVTMTPSKLPVKLLLLLLLVVMLSQNSGRLEVAK